jgi:DNA helicase-2/ATP-dependent DNA helicase PcrA
MTTELNNKQKEVLEHDKGPMLIVAGAGTGKTTTVIEKVKQLLGSGIKSESILALTFTEKAAREMLDRLLEETDKLNLEIPMMTFNAFGESILREFANHIGLGRSFRVLGEQAQIVFVRERIDEFGLDYFLPLANLPDSVISDLLDLFSRAKQSLVTPEQYKAFADKMPTTSEAERLERKQHIELASAYSSYVRLCAAENLIDYDDQIFLLVQLLHKRPNIRQVLQKRYAYIVVDEFQDTNFMQSSLIDLLVSAEQNLIVVGDDDQSIYGFRGADLSNILSFKERFKTAKEVALTKNYRSSQPILDAAYKLIQNNNPHRLETTLKINKKLVSDVIGEEPQLRHFEHIDFEIEWLAEDIAKRINSGQKPGSIAVLARRRQTAKLVASALTRHQVSHKLVGFREDMYAQPAVRMLTELARTLAEPSNNNSLHHTLTSALFNIPNADLANEAVNARYNHESLEDILLSSGKKHVIEPILLIQKWRESAATKSVGQLLFQAIEQTGFKAELFKAAEHDENSADTVLALGQYFGSLKSFEAIASQPTVYEFMLSLPALKSAGDRLDDTLDISEDQVNVLTVHKAKGLEWETVYIPQLVEGSFPLKKMAEGLQLPDGLFMSPYDEAKDHYREERRLMYVAMTRAKQNLIFSYSDFQGSSSSKRTASRFLGEIFELLPETAPSDNKSNDIENPEQHLTTALEIPSEIYDGKYVYLSVSQAASLLNCPLDFYYKFILRAPEKPEPQTSYGTALHALIEQMNRSLMPGGEAVSLESLEQELSLNWVKSGYASKAQERRAYKTAKATLTRLFNALAERRTPTYIEEPFTVLLEDEGVVLRGRYDVAYDDEAGVEIRDYKSGIGVNSEEKAKKRAQGSVQLSMYALAWLVQKGQLPDKLSLEFIDTGIEASVRKTDKGIESLRKRLADSAEMVKSKHFPLGSSRHEHCIHP